MWMVKNMLFVKKNLSLKLLIEELKEYNEARRAYSNDYRCQDTEL